MRSNSTAGVWMGSAFGAAAVLAALTLAVFGAGERGTLIALQATARLSFLPFWLAYAGGGLAALGGPSLHSLKRHGRDFGLAFAAAHLVHIGLIAWLCRIGAAPATGVFLFFGPALAFTYVLALFSIGRLHRALGRTGWRLLRTIGLNCIAYAFAADFLRDPLQGGAKHLAEYLPFALLSVAGVGLYLVSLVAPLRRTDKAVNPPATARPSPPRPGACSPAGTPPGPCGAAAGPAAGRR